MKNKAKETAAQLYMLSKQKEYDPVLLFFSIVKLTEHAPLEETLQLYKKAVYGEIIAAHIVSAREIKEKDFNLIQTRLSEVLNKEVIAYPTVDKTLLGGIRVEIDDYVLDDSLISKIMEFSE